MPRPSTGNAYAGILPPLDLGAGGFRGPVLPRAFAMIAPYLARDGYPAAGGLLLVEAPGDVAGYHA